MLKNKNKQNFKNFILNEDLLNVSLEAAIFLKNRNRL